MTMVAKTMGLPPELLTRLEARANLWNRDRSKRPNHLRYSNCTWADVVRSAAEEFLGAPLKTQARLPLKKARKKAGTKR